MKNTYQTQAEKPLLAISVGNTDILLGCVTENDILCRIRVAADPARSADEYALLLRDLLAFHGFTPDGICHAMLASVCPALTEKIREAAALLLGKRVFLLTSGTKTGLSILTDHPAELGADLVASAVGALSQYAPPLLLVHLGTASTVSAIDKSGAFIGCAIAPGIVLSGKALSASAALLPDLSPCAPARVIGKNTEQSMQSGAIYGAAAMIDGMLFRMEAEMGEQTVTALLSGDTADAVAPYCTHPILREDDLILRGLYVIDCRNRKKR